MLDETHRKIVVVSAVVGGHRAVDVVASVQLEPCGGCRGNNIELARMNGVFRPPIRWLGPTKALMHKCKSQCVGGVSYTCGATAYYTKSS